MIDKKNLYIAIAESDATKLKELCQNELGLSARKGAEQLIQVFIRQPEVRKTILSKINETRLKLLEEEMAKVRETMVPVPSPTPAKK